MISVELIEVSVKTWPSKAADENRRNKLAAELTRVAKKRRLVSLIQEHCIMSQAMSKTTWSYLAVFEDR